MSTTNQTKTVDNHPSPIPVDEPLTKQNVVAAFIETVHGIGAEVDAWRAFGSDVVEYLKSKKLSDDFERFRAKRAARRTKNIRR